MAVLTHLNFPNQTAFYQGKVRDVYTIDTQWLVLVASNRISAFDVILPAEIPFKGQVLNQIALKFLELTANIVPNWLVQSPHPAVSIGYACKPIPIEMVVRGFLAGHAWREYQAGKRELCGVKLPEGMAENDPFPQPIITPTTKAAQGHDEDISRDAIFKSNIISEADYTLMEKYALQLFEFGSNYAAQRGLILVDTKYEFGWLNNRVVLMDEIHTPDSSRYFYADGYARRQQNGEPQKQLSKEFVRQWLIAQGFQGKAGQKPPYMPNEFVQHVSNRYIDLYEQLTGEKFIPHTADDLEEKIVNSLRQLRK